MNCGECRSILESYALDELAEAQNARCREHLDACQACRAELEVVTSILDAMAATPVLKPTPAESAALAEALSRVELCPYPKPAEAEPIPRGFPAFVLASILAFLGLATMLGLQCMGVIDLCSAASRIGFKWLAAAAVVVVFVTSFIPIAVTAYRRPLNGMTFRG